MKSVWDRDILAAISGGVSQTVSGSGVSGAGSSLLCSRGSPLVVLTAVRMHSFLGSLYFLSGSS